MSGEPALGGTGLLVAISLLILRLDVDAKRIADGRILFASALVSISRDGDFGGWTLRGQRGDNQGYRRLFNAFLWIDALKPRQMCNDFC